MTARGKRMAMAVAVARRAAGERLRRGAAHQDMAWEASIAADDGGKAPPPPANKSAARETKATKAQQGRQKRSKGDRPARPRRGRGGPVGDAALALGDEGAEVLEVRLGGGHELERRQVVRDVRQVARAHPRHQRPQRVAQRLRLHERVRNTLLPVVAHLVQPARPNKAPHTRSRYLRGARSRGIAVALVCRADAVAAPLPPPPPLGGLLRGLVAAAGPVGPSGQGQTAPATAETGAAGGAGGGAGADPMPKMTSRTMRHEMPRIHRVVMGSGFMCPGPAPRTPPPPPPPSPPPRSELLCARRAARARAARGRPRAKRA